MVASHVEVVIDSDGRPVSKCFIAGVSEIGLLSPLVSN